MTKFQDKVFIELLTKKGLGPPEKEFRFHNKRKWRLDYAYPSLKIGIEINGGAWKKTTYRNKRGELVTAIGGRHNIGKGYLRDIEKKNTLTILGWAILEFTPDQTSKSETIDQIALLIQARKVQWQNDGDKLWLY
ncbi:MAG TPA: hypothetical protein PKU71_13590 [bacterium]|nr:hypothetical protein [bacterium]